MPRNADIPETKVLITLNSIIIFSLLLLLFKIFHIEKFLKKKTWLQISTNHFEKINDSLKECCKRKTLRGEQRWHFSISNVLWLSTGRGHVVAVSVQWRNTSSWSYADCSCHISMVVSFLWRLQPLSEPGSPAFPVILV